MKEVDVILTALDRLDLLERTLDSFFHFNTYPINKLIIRDDSGLKYIWDDTEVLLRKYKNECEIEFLEDGQLGQAKSIDKLVERVDSPYIFHLEDDWEFDRPGFIEDCLEVIDEEVAQVRVTHRGDWNKTETIPYNNIADRCTNHLFSFNPHLRRTELLYSFEGQNETILGKLIEDNGLKTLWLKEGACRHIGEHKTTNRAGTTYNAGVLKA